MYFRKYLNAMGAVLENIEDSGRELYVARCGNWSDGVSVLFGLPCRDGGDDDKPISNLSEGETNYVDSLLKDYRHGSFSDGRALVFKFDKLWGFSKGTESEDGRKEEVVTLEGLHKILAGRSSCIFYKSVDSC